jgi:hypothetical protein
MKKHLMTLLGAAAIAVTFNATSLRAADVVEEKTTTTTTTSAGTITEFGPERIVIRSETQTSPLTYSYSKTTTYVDEAGNPVSVETVKSGSPVTIHYTKDGDKLIASKVIVRKTTTKTEK